MLFYFFVDMRPSQQIDDSKNFPRFTPNVQNFKKTIHNQKYFQAVTRSPNLINVHMTGNSYSFCNCYSFGPCDCTEWRGKFVVLRSYEKLSPSRNIYNSNNHSDWINFQMCTECVSYRQRIVRQSSYSLCRF